MLVILAGCGAINAKLLRTDPAGVHSFRVNAAYQDVYEKALSRAQACAQQATFGDNASVQGRLFTDRKRASISILNSNIYAGGALLTIDIAQADADETEVMVFYALRRHKPAALLVEDWIIKNSSGCPRGGSSLECGC